MGNELPPPKKMSLQDGLIEMKIQSKRILREANKSEKQSQKYRKQAKDALKKNNEDFAKLYMTSASQKRTESLNYRRTAIKMQLMCDQMKSLKNNQSTINTFNKMAGLVGEQMSNISMEKMGNQMQLFNDQMDEVLINNKMMNQLLQKDENVDVTANQMLSTLKEEIAMEEKGKLIDGGKQSNNGYSIKNNQQDKDNFLDQLKGL